jgi:hypothetical protein
MQHDVDGTAYKSCIRISCGVIWPYVYEPHKPEPKGCNGTDPT